VGEIGVWKEMRGIRIGLENDYKAVIELAALMVVD
jgi:hypothetical protein